MLIDSYRVLAIPLWTVALAAFAFGAPLGMRPSLIALLWLSLIVFTTPTLFQWLRPSRLPVEVLPALRQNPERPRSLLTAGTRVRTLADVVDTRRVTADDAVDLLRLDDDGGRPVDTVAASPERRMYTQR